MFIPVRFALIVVCFATIGSGAQDTSNSAQELVRVSRELQQTRAELAESRRQIEELRQGLEQLRQQVQANHPTGNQPPPAEPTTAAADQDVGFLAAKVAELHQDKVESASRYPVKLSGLILFNAYRNSGSLDVQDLPSLAFPTYQGSPDGSIGATLRQTVLGIDATGPKVFGAHTSANAEIDFAGGSPTTSYGVASGLLRLRTAQINLDWEKSSLHLGQDAPLFSPLSPTSYATMAEPALAWSGNLWVWTPQIEGERRLSLRPDSVLVLQGGILDPLTERRPRSKAGYRPQARRPEFQPLRAGLRSTALPRLVFPSP
jgi:hypothetical protein